MSESQSDLHDSVLSPYIAELFERWHRHYELAVDQSAGGGLSRSEEYRDAAVEGGLQLRRLTTVHNAARSVRDALSKAAQSKVFWGCASAAYVGASMLLYGAGGTLPPGMEPDLIDLDKLQETLPLTMGVVGTGVAAVMASHFDRGYARLMGLTEALHRLDDGADPNAERFSDRLSEEERESFSRLIMRARLCQKEGPVAIAQFLTAARNTIDRALDHYAGSPDAYRILDLIDEMNNALDAGKQTLDHPEYSTPLPARSTPSF